MPEDWRPQRKKFFSWAYLLLLCFGQFDALLEKGECLIWRWEFARITLNLNRVQIHLHSVILPTTRSLSHTCGHWTLGAVKGFSCPWIRTIGQCTYSWNTAVMAPHTRSSQINVIWSEAWEATARTSGEIFQKMAMWESSPCLATSPIRLHGLLHDPFYTRRVTPANNNNNKNMQ